MERTGMESWSMNISQRKHLTCLAQMKNTGPMLTRFLHTARPKEFWFFCFRPMLDMMERNRVGCRNFLLMGLKKQRHTERGSRPDSKTKKILSGCSWAIWA